MGKDNSLAINRTRTLTQQLELKTDIFSSIMFLFIAIFILIAIVVYKQKSSKC